MVGASEPAKVNEVTVAVAPSVAMAMTYASLATSIDKLAQGAVTNQRGGQQVALTVTATACAWIIKNATKS